MPATPLQFYKSIKAHLDPRLPIVLEARVTLSREEAGALAPIPALFVMPGRPLRLITAADAGPQGLKWSR